MVTTPPNAGEEGCARLRELARVHRLVAGRIVPHVIDECITGPTPWVALDCDAIADGDHIADYVVETGDKSKHASGTWVPMILMQTLAGMHRVHDPSTGEPVCLGSMARANLLFGADGRMWLVGCGAGALSDAFVAPEVACGAPATPGADVYAVTMFMRAQISVTEMLPIALRIYAGRMLPDDAEAARGVAFSQRIPSLPPHERPTMEEALAHSLNTWRLFGFTPDADGFRAWAAHALAAGLERIAATPRPGESPRIRLGAEAEWLETPNGMRHSLRARRPLRRLLVALASAHRSRVGSSLTVDDLLQAGWPGESPLPEAGSNRVYVAISTLRGLGLDDHLQRWDGGYRLDPAIRIHVEGIDVHDT